MSDTPETDHLEVQLGQAAMHSHPILWEHSRRMERERDEARHEIEGWRNKWDIAVTMAARAENERDEAREELNRYKRQWEESRSENVEK
jgi:uncharacterized protein (DUF3084 family)